MFGFEHVLPGFKIMETTTFAGMGPVSNVLLLLVMSIALGVFMLLLVMVINIINGVRQRNFEKILFGHNGVAGILFYAGSFSRLWPPWPSAWICSLPCMCCRCSSCPWCSCSSRNPCPVCWRGPKLEESLAGRTAGHRVF